MAADHGLAPLDVGAFGALAALLPPESTSLPSAEGALMQLALKGCLLDPSTPLEAVLRFRDRHAALAGRLRGSLIDLASTIDVERSPSAVLSQAEAVISNRVEPALADLETELNRSGFSFVWRELLGVGGVAGGGSATPVSVGGAVRAAGRGIHYAFDREALVREHPFGYLYRIRASFAAQDDDSWARWQRPVTNPRQELIDIFEGMYSAAYRADPRHEWTLRVIGSRCMNPKECARVLFEESAARIGQLPQPWWEDSSGGGGPQLLAKPEHRDP